jgi:membrane-bound serine protease (ClpP class)
MNPWLIVLIVIVAVVVIYFVVLWVVRAHRRQVTTGKEDLIGKVAVVETELHPKGTVIIEGEIWTAVIDKGKAEPQEEVIITRVDGLKLTVTKKK